MGVLPIDLSVTSVLLWTALAFAAYFMYSWLFYKTPQNLPPGPRAWGTSWKMLRSSMKGELHELATEWAKQYGPVVYINSLGRQMAFLNSIDLARKILASDEFKYVVKDRESAPATDLAFYNGKDLVMAKYDAIMKKKRRMFHQVLAMYGDGVEKFETVVQAEMERLFQELEEHENEDFELWRSLARSLKIIIYTLCLGERPSDPNTPDILEEFDVALNKLIAPEYDIALTMFPFLAKIPGKIKAGVDRLRTARRAAEELVYYSPKRSHVPGSPRGIVDILLDMRKEPGNEWMDEDPEHIMAFMLSLFVAAQLTSRSTLLAAFLCFINYPKVARNIQEEIDKVIGNQQPKVEDRANMPYTEATILELLRLASQFPLYGLRKVDSDIHLDGMTIPKGTVLVINGWYFHHDKKVWEDPWTLKPERFLSSKGQILPADDPVRKSILPFGSGIRSCPGEVFARSRVFLFVTNILQKYDVLPPANEELVPADFRTNHESVKGFVRQVQPFKCRLQRRQKTAE